MVQIKSAVSGYNQERWQGQLRQRNQVQGMSKTTTNNYNKQVMSKRLLTTTDFREIGKKRA